MSKILVEQVAKDSKELQHNW